MPYVVYSPEAEEDLVGIADYIARDKPGAARHWVRRIRATCERLATQPDMGEWRSEFGVADCRHFTVGHYVIFFRPIENGIEVARVVHGGRDLRNL